MDVAADDAAGQLLGKAPATRSLTQRARRDYIVGICILLVVVFLWTASNFVTQVCNASRAYKQRLKLVVCCTGLV